ncbi:HAD family phosphatase [Mucilaginibacter rubeus]|uniref:HAD family phosphatase n=1 Tax=Mucilaginibacter rubeus TaxID=2027860 RepID=A0AAE6MKT8_9SPHI|nr:MULTISPECIES: HAD family phosphatase [Mucilaginibacter]QEM06814.1 HAD family phosphatase [Mucilaginibacter rubeus]QEM19401.1 HAD family phosphatase [Mucilaginibacter gossypii]QTE44049.1 HAD family phosphatase [Mucilaginibacter rubeus]QTE50650.1 HAD family phosphatase [Mucilaginibacter rubeus]QTE55734.1 HAD family phosphatase [Mucilaginibacter rubeus]
MINTIIFDLGAVLIDWNPHYMYRTLFTDEQEMIDFLANICTSDWNEEQDAGRSLQEGTDLLVAQFPEHEANIRAFYSRWIEMLGDPFHDTVEIFKQLKESGKYKIYALTNWSAETFPMAQERFDFLAWFDGIVVSGAEKMRKPTPAFYQTLLDRYHVNADEALFIDDNYRNILAAEKMGIECIHFTSAEALEIKLKELEVL